MKVVLCLFALLAVALARPQSEGYQFWPETLARAQQLQFVLPNEKLLDFQVAPLVNQRENVPYNVPVQVNQIVVPLDEPAVYQPLQRNVDELLTRY
ncbi:hypothetical protein ZHAS_00013061 [Anopheles sinensis]|uniref:Uncharacterized protein n=1 Tax=Anopheles sinensis TaxID=74873 RepID=A0A084W4T2_ANOSI|nr:hypothetical protein ZHAS_00013061 [Anopheles sinensis]